MFRAERAGAATSLVIVIAFWIVFSTSAPGFLSPFNLNSSSRRSLAVDIVVGFSTMVGAGDRRHELAIGSIGVCAVMFAGYLIQVSASPTPLAIARRLALGALLGWVNGFAIVRSGVNAFIMTLASASLFDGGMLITDQGRHLTACRRQSPPSAGCVGASSRRCLIVALAIGVALCRALSLHGARAARFSPPAPMPAPPRMSGVPVGRVIMHRAYAVWAARRGRRADAVSRDSARAMPSIGQRIGCCLPFSRRCSAARC